MKQKALLSSAFSAAAAAAAVAAVGGTADVRISDPFSSQAMYDNNLVGRRYRGKKMSPGQRVVENQRKKNSSI